MCRQFHQEQYIPRWTGFNIRVRDQVLVMESTVHYLDCLGAPATEIATIQEVMERALKMKDTLKISGIACVFDQSIFEKAAEIKWKSPEKYKDCVLVLGAFHMITSFMSILAKRFEDTGLRDTLVQTGILADGPVNSAISGRMYNRGIRSNKLAYEAFYTLLLENMESFYEADAWNQSFISEAKEELANSAKNLLKSTYTEHKDSREFQTFYRLFLDYRNHITKNGGDLAKFWLTFLDMVSILLNTIHVTRCGNWDLYFECVRSIIPYVFAYDHLN